MFNNEIHGVYKLSVRDYVDVRVYRALTYAPTQPHTTVYVYVATNADELVNFLRGNDTGTPRRAAFRVGIPALVFNATHRSKSIF